jgi:uncharacterized protein YqcC (DUF446 family)
LFNVPLQPYVIARVGTAKPGFVETLLEVEAEMTLKWAFLPRIDPHLNANNNVVSV